MDALQKRRYRSQLVKLIAETRERLRVLVGDKLVSKLVEVAEEHIKLEDTLASLLDAESALVPLLDSQYKLRVGAKVMITTVHSADRGIIQVGKIYPVSSITYTPTLTQERNQYTERVCIAVGDNKPHYYISNIQYESINLSDMYMHLNL